MMHSNINTENVNASLEIPTLDGNLSTSTLIGNVDSNTLTGVSNANTLEGSIGSAVIGSGIKAIFVNNIQQNVINDIAYLGITYNMLYDKPTIPTKLSDLENDEGFINSGYASEDDFTALSNQVGIIENNITDVNNDIEEIESNIDEINETLTNKVNQTDFNNLQTQVTTNSNNISANTSNIATNTSNIATLTNITDAQSATITSMTSLIEDNSDAIGTLSNLTTSDKTSLVNAVNEVKSDIPEYVSDLSNDLGFITNTDYGTASKGGVIKSANGLGINASGTVYADPKTYAYYTSATDGLFVGKGTLENVITGKGLVNTTDLATKQDTLVSGTNIKTINSQSLLGSGDITITGGQATDVQINGTSITSNNTANIETNSTYDETTNKIATMSDLPVIPTNVSTFTNDAGYITNTVNDLTNYTLTSNLATVATSGDYNDLTNLPTIPTVPTNVSAFTNDSGYITATDYASASTGGVIKSANGLGINASGTVYADPKTYAYYTSATDGLFVGKGTLENVITGKNLADNGTYTLTVDSNYIDYTTNLTCYRVGNMLFVGGAFDFKVAVPTRTTFITINGINSSVSGNQFGGTMHKGNSTAYRLRCLNDNSNIVIQAEGTGVTTGWYNIIFIIFL